MWEEACQALLPLEKKLPRQLWPHYYNSLLYILLQLGRVEEANALAGTWEKRLSGAKGAPLQSAIRDTFALLRFRNGDLAGSKQLFRECLDLTVSAAAQAGQHYYLGRIALLEGDREEASRQFRQSLLLGANTFVPAKLTKYLSAIPELAEMMPESMSKYDRETIGQRIRALGGHMDNNIYRQVVVVMAAIILAVLLTSFYWQGFTPQGAYLSGDLESAVDFAVDRMVESGLFPGNTDYDDPLLTQTRTIVITEEINEKTSKEVAGKLLYLNSLDSATPIDLVVKTHGGWQNDAYLICDIMQRIDAPVNTWSAGSSYSAGAMIVAAGTGTRHILPNAMIMVHIVEWEGDEPTAYPYESRSRTEAFWRRYTKLPEEYYPMIEEREYYFLPEEAVKYGIVDKIYQKEL